MTSHYIGAERKYIVYECTLTNVRRINGDFDSVSFSGILGPGSVFSSLQHNNCTYTVIGNIASKKNTNCEITVSKNNMSLGKIIFAVDSINNLRMIAVGGIICIGDILMIMGDDILISRKVSRYTKNFEAHTIHQIRTELGYQYKWYRGETLVCATDNADQCIRIEKNNRIIISPIGTYKI